MLTISRVRSGALGLDNIALLLPAIVGAGGAAEVIEPALHEVERAALSRSAGILHSAIDSVV